ncbi:formimidoylglutamate deiminase [Lujinxingia litoralis]|uniref:Formimidoylglutamate deiminase n=1 Tax=Lujinxingia litoralis TaxID=2211119 RepID=A0A328C759_9DELT|nr:formimidoylglutamate deiminase [Lujinxingia litoralis]RAL22388.1 formimidoylglutamate deiminase [Lujinxingia litoralis]
MSRPRGGGRKSDGEDEMNHSAAEQRPEQDLTEYRARYVWSAGGWEERASVWVRGGQVIAVGDLEARPERYRSVDLGEVALVPGQINAHSHAFQRVMRGAAERRDPERPNDNFWTWREAMYGLALSLSAEEVEAAARLAFWEMARAGITQVGEFHYVHHRPDGQAYEDPNELAHRVIQAAQAVGIRIALLRVAYHSGDIGQPASPRQRRFIEPDVQTYLERLSALEARWGEVDKVSLGAAPHSIRAVDRSWVEAIADHCRSRDLVTHIHVCEQPAEIDAARRAYGMGPVEALHAWAGLDARWTLVHATHLNEREHAIVAETRPTVCACPTTERNLGDGFLPARRLIADAVPVALGSDSHTVIDPWEELRLVEYHERLRAQARNVLPAHAPGAQMSTAAVLWPMGTTWGGRALGRALSGCIEAGEPADFVALDLGDPGLWGAEPQTLLDHMVLSMSASAVRHTIVAGELVIEDRRHVDEDALLAPARDFLARRRAR